MSWRPVPGEGGREPQPVRASLERLATGLGLDDVDVLHACFAAWEEAVGETVARHARPWSLRSGVLTVRVDHPSWATQLQFLAPTLLDALRDAAGRPVAERIEVRIGRPSPPQRSRPSPSGTPGERGH
jgi:predicted nucleic acid-binding Zn ribbon protein